MRRPFSSTSPLVGAKRPLIRLNSVDLPAPLGPMTAMRSPGRHLQVDAADDLGLAEALAQVAQFQREFGHAVLMPGPPAAWFLSR
jgi:hypothetical protein